jgi:hypothetical protein
MHQPAVPSRFNEVEEDLTRAGVLRLGRIGRSRSLLVDGPRFREFMLGELSRNPSYLLKQPDESRAAGELAAVQ